MSAHSAKKLSTQTTKIFLSTNNKVRKIIALLLSLKILLAGMEAAGRINKGESVTETLIWLINQCIPVLQQVSRQQDEKK